MKKYTIIVLAFITLSGCSQAWYDARKDRKLETLAVERKSTFLDISNRLNPCFQGKAKSDTTVTHDTTQTAGDTSIITVHDTIKIKIRLPGKRIVDTKTIHDTIPDLRGIATLNDQVSSAKDDLIKAQQQLADKTKDDSKYHWMFFGLLGLVVLYFGVKIYTTVVSGGALKKFI